MNKRTLVTLPSRGEDFASIPESWKTRGWVGRYTHATSVAATYFWLALLVGGWHPWGVVSSRFGGKPGISWISEASSLGLWSFVPPTHPCLPMRLDCSHIHGHLIGGGMSRGFVSRRPRISDTDMVLSLTKPPTCSQQFSSAYPSLSRGGASRRRRPSDPPGQGFGNTPEGDLVPVHMLNARCMENDLFFLNPRATVFVSCTPLAHV